MESIAILRWVPSTVLADGEEAVVDWLEDALNSTLTANGLVGTGDLRVRAVRPGEYPQADAAQPDDDPGALLHLAEVDVTG